MAAKTQFRLKSACRNSYLALVSAFPLASIKSEAHLSAAEEVMDRLLAQDKMDEGEDLYLDALSDLVRAYEDAHHPIAPSSDADMLRHLMDAKGITQAQLSKEAALPKSTVSEILSGRKTFSLHVMRKLATYFKVDVSVLAANV